MSKLKRTKQMLSVDPSDAAQRSHVDLEKIARRALRALKGVVEVTLGVFVPVLKASALKEDVIW